MNIKKLKIPRGVKFSKNVLAWCFALIMMSLVAVGGAQQPDPNVAIESEQLAVESYTLPNLTDISLPNAGKEIQSINFRKDISIRDALTFLAAKYQKNIVPSPKVDGQLAFTNLFNVTFDEAMNAILGADFKYEQNGNLTRVYTTDEYLAIKNDLDRLEYKIFTLFHINSLEAAALISPLKSPLGKIESTSAAIIGIPTSETIGTGGGGGDTIAMQDTIVVYDFPENLKLIEEVLQEIDVRPKQVLIEATILSATLTEGMDLGVNLNFMSGGSLSGQTTASSETGSSDDLITETVTSPIQQIAGGQSIEGTMIETTGFATIGDGLRVGIRSGDIAAFITALETATDVTLMANPKILAVNKQLGEVYIGKKIGYRSQVTQTDTSTTENVQFLDTGTKLSFRPYIGNDGYIRMDIHPKDSSGNLNAQGIPDEDSTELSTNLLLKDGQTIVIGGLFRDLVSSTRSQIPILGDLPIIGQLFRSNTDVSQRQEVIVLLTCHIIENPEDIDYENRIDDIGRKRMGARKGLNWSDRAKIAEENYADAAVLYARGDLQAALEQLETALRIRPTYLEAIRLKERIIAELNPEKAEKLERKVLSEIDDKQAPLWIRW